MKKTLIGLIGITIAIVVLGCSLGTSEAESTIPIRNPYVSVQPKCYAYVIGGTEEETYTTTPQLGIEIYDWDPDNGALSLQWYAFDSIEEYCHTKGGRLLAGETGLTYQPPQLTPEADRRYYYYVQITNTNDVTNRKVVTINSELAVISFRNVGDPVIPVVTRQAIGGSYQFGRAIGGMKVDATAGESAALSYQWYSLKDITDFSFDLANADLIEGATQSSFMPGVENLNAGANYFFVHVTNTEGFGSQAKTAIEFGLPASIEMLLGEKAFAPRIDVQPQGQLAFAGEAIDPLSVQATSLDSGVLSYQWYSNTRSAITGGTAIEGATGGSYQPDITSGIRYYYVTVTNTNDKVASEEKTAVLNSKVAKVSIGTSGTPAANATINILNPSVAENRYQYVRGYGGMEVLWGNFPETTPEDTELMFDPDRLGYNMHRIMIPPTSTDMDANMLDASTRLRPHYYTNVKIVNKYNGYVLASPWSPPKEWKSNNSVNGGGVLIPAYYKLFANYLKNYAQHMYDKGAPVYAVSISNEPNYTAGYDGCEWTGNEMRDFFIEVGHFTDGVRGYGGGRETPVVLTMNGESANTPLINLPVLRDPKANAAVDVLARHIYGEQTVSLYNQYRDLLGDKEVWMTEHNVNSANATGYTLDSTWNFVWRFMNDVDLVMRMNNENAFVWWASKRFYSMIGDGQYSSPEGQALPRGYGLSHYSKFTIDTTRIGWEFAAGSTFPNGTPVGIPNTNYSAINSTTWSLDNLTPRITAYVSQDGSEISMILWTPTQTNGNSGSDMGTIKINFPEGFTVRGAYAVRSTAPIPGSDVNTYMVEEEVTISPDRQSAYVTLPRSNLLSVKFTR